MYYWSCFLKCEFVKTLIVFQITDPTKSKHRRRWHWKGPRYALFHMFHKLFIIQGFGQILEEVQGRIFNKKTEAIP